VPTYTFRKRTRRNERRLDVNFFERKTIQEKENSMNITNKAVLITGANRGIGRVLVNEALRRGAKRVYAGARSAFHHADKRVTPLTLDVTSASQIQRAAAEVDSLDVLINNAGISTTIWAIPISSSSTWPSTSSDR